jgi:hypothetical protein
MTTKTKWIIGSIVGLLILGALTGGNQETNQKSEVVEEKKPKPTISVSIPKMKYKLVYESDKVRSDGGYSYYILIDPVDLSNATFKEDIKAIVKKLVSEKGNKISVDILDNSETLDLFYNSHYGVNKLGRILTKDELSEIALHSIASYSGDMDINIYKNTLYFFAGASKDHPTVGKYVEISEFDASK